MNTKPLTELQSMTYQIIKDHGRSNPIIGADIQRQINLTDRDHKKGANLRSIINALRDKGYAICASDEGYYYAQNPQELKDYIDEFQARINQQQEACNSLINKYNSWVGIVAYTAG